MPFLASRALGASLLATVFTACTPIAPIEAQTPPESAEAIHRQSIVIDAHADIVLPETPISYLGNDGLSQVAPQKLKEGGVTAVVMAVAVGPGERTEKAKAEAGALAHAKLLAVRGLAEDPKNNLSIATTSQDVFSAKRDGTTAVVLGFQNARALQGELDAIDTFYAEGVRVFGLTHLGHNDFADSSRPLYDGVSKTYEPEEEHGGLSTLGVAAIERLNQLGAIIDVSQMSKSATLQTLRLSKAPVIASHSNVKALSNVTRNLSDAEIDLIGKKGGVIHVSPFGGYLVDLSHKTLRASVRNVRLKAGLPEKYSYPYELYWEIEDPKRQRLFVAEMRQTIGKGTVDDMLDHLDYIVKRIGIDHVGIGSDFNHGGGVESFDDASEAPNVTAALV